MTILEATIKNAIGALTYIELDELAASTSTPGDLLKRLSKNPYFIIRAQVAANPSTSPEVLDVLGKDTDNFVRLCVAQNPSALMTTLRKLTTDTSSNVRDMAQLTLQDGGDDA